MKYATATGEEVHNLGEVMLPMITFEGHKEEDEDASDSSVEAPCER